MPHSRYLLRHSNMGVSCPISSPPKSHLLSPVGAVVIVRLTVHAAESRAAPACERRHVVVARGAVLAGVTGAFVHVRLAVLALKAVHAGARVVEYSVYAGAAVQTRI